MKGESEWERKSKRTHSSTSTIVMPFTSFTLNFGSWIRCRQLEGLPNALARAPAPVSLYMMGKSECHRVIDTIRCEAIPSVCVLTWPRNRASKATSSWLSVSTAHHTCIDGVTKHVEWHHSASIMNYGLTMSSCFIALSQLVPV